MSFCKDCGVVDAPLANNRCIDCLAALVQSVQTVVSVDEGDDDDNNDDGKPTLVENPNRSSGDQRRKLLLDEDLGNCMKRHQKDGLKFILKSCFGDWPTGESSRVGGCILAHFMGLGKKSDCY